MNNVLCSILHYVLILSFFLGPIQPCQRVWAKSESEQSEVSQQIPPALQKIILNIENAREFEPPPESEDIFHLTKQEYDVFHSLLSNHAPKLEIEVFRQGFAFILRNKDQIVAQHKFLEFDILASAEDEDIFQFLDSRGKIYVVNLEYARKSAFNGPIPVFEVAQVSEDVMRKIKDGTSEVKAGFISRGFTPPTNDSHTKYTAGDFVLYTERNHTREFIDIFDRSVTYTQMYVGQSLLAFVAQMISSDAEQTTQKAVFNLLQDKNILQSAKAFNKVISPQMRSLLSGVSKPNIKELLSHTKNVKEKIQNPRDVFLHEEWVQFVNDLEGLKQQSETEDLAYSWQNYVQESHSVVRQESFYQLLSSSSLKKIALYTLGSGAVLGAVGLAHKGYGPAWAVYLVNSIYRFIVPDVLRDQAYRTTLLKSCISLASFVPLLWGVASLVSKSKNWDYRKAITLVGIRVAAVFQYPYHLKFLEFGQQKGLLDAIKVGVNPFAMFEGRRVGASSEALEGFVRKRNETKALAWAMANLVVCEKYKLNGHTSIDPVTMFMAQLGKFDHIDVNELYTNQKFQKEWLQTSQELYSVFAKISKPNASIQLMSLDRDEIVHYYQLAKQTIQKIEKRSFLKKKVLAAANWWKNFDSNRVLNFISHHNYEQYDYLKNVDPSKFVYTSTWREFVIDYLVTIFQVAVLGDRANLSEPEDLSADSKGPLWTNRRHLTDVSEDIVDYLVETPTRLVQTYGDEEKSKQNAHYDPIEKLTLTGQLQPEGFIKGLQRWVSGVVNVKEANYGYYFFRALEKKLKSLQSSFIVYTTCRLLIAQQSFFAEVIPTFIFGVFAAPWQYEWIWQPIWRGNHLYTRNIELKNEYFLKAKISINQGLRLRDPSKVAYGRELMLKLYSKSNRAFLVSLSPKALLEYSLQHPPFASEKNPHVQVATTTIGSTLTTYGATSLLVSTYHSLPWLKKILSAASISIAMYSGIYFIQKMIYKFSKKIDHLDVLFCQENLKPISG